jgi:hypothetical protein
MGDISTALLCKIAISQPGCGSPPSRTAIAPPCDEIGIGSTITEDCVPNMTSGDECFSTVRGKYSTFVNERDVLCDDFSEKLSFRLNSLSIGLPLRRRRSTVSSGHRLTTLKRVWTLASPLFDLPIIKYTLPRPLERPKRVDGHLQYPCEPSVDSAERTRSS